MAILVKAVERLKTYALRNLIDRVDSTLTDFDIHKVARPYPNPREYRKKAPPELLDKVQKAFEAQGFKFRRLPIHSMDTKAVESEGVYGATHYILDLVFRHHDLEVDLYY